MRKIILTSGLFLLAIVAFSQQGKNSTTYVKHRYTEHSIKAYLDNDQFTMLPAAVADVNEKVLKSFNETFAAAQDVKWEEFKNYYTVSFVHSGIRSKVNYDRNGYVIGSRRYYTPEHLPLNIHNKLRKEYSKMELYGVIEVTVQAEVTYFVKIQDEQNWMTIKIDPSGISTVCEKYRK